MAEEIFMGHMLIDLLHEQDSMLVLRIELFIILF